MPFFSSVLTLCISLSPSLNDSLSVFNFLPLSSLRPSISSTGSVWLLPTGLTFTCSHEWQGNSPARNSNTGSRQPRNSCLNTCDIQQPAVGGFNQWELCKPSWTICVCVSYLGFFLLVSIVIIVFTQAITYVFCYPVSCLICTHLEVSGMLINSTCHLTLWTPKTQPVGLKGMLCLKN